MDESVTRPILPRRMGLVHGAPGFSATSLSSRGRLSRTAQLRTGLLLGCCLAFGLAGYFGEPSAYLLADPTLARLLRGMALIKGLIAIAAVTAVYWRLVWPLSGSVAAIYVVSSWALVGSSMLIWQLSSIAIAAVIFHAAVLSMLVVGWREK